MTLSRTVMEHVLREKEGVLVSDASRDARLGAWRRHRVRYPLWYVLRAVRALVRGERTPSRFDLWESVAT